MFNLPSARSKLLLTLLINKFSFWCLLSKLYKTLPKLFCLFVRLNSIALSWINSLVKPNSTKMLPWLELKNKGNSLYGLGHYEEALDMYCRASTLLESQYAKTEMSNSVKADLAKIYSNRSVAQLKTALNVAGNYNQNLTCNLDTCIICCLFTVTH